MATKRQKRLAARWRPKRKVPTLGFTNKATHELYAMHWPNDPVARALHDGGLQCLGCGHYAPLDTDWGRCRNLLSRHYGEIIFEHFTCTAFALAAEDPPRDWTVWARFMFRRSKSGGRRS
jgi:hypothetical protein